MQKLTYSEGKVARSSMGIGTNDQAPDEGRLKGKQAPAACGVWFTSNGRILPKMLKYQEEDGQIVTLTHIQVETAEEKHYCGIPTLRYKCTGECAEESGKGADGSVQETVEFTLLYYTERQEWKLLM